MNARSLRVAVPAAMALCLTAAVLTSAANASPEPETPNYSDAVLADQPFLYWRLDEKSGSIAQDSSVNGRDGTYVGASKRAVPGLIADDPDTAVHVYGGSGVTWTPSTEHIQGMYTTEAWARPVADGLNLSIITSRTSEAARSFDVKFSTAQGRGIRIDVGDGTQWLTTTTVPFDWRLYNTYLVDAAVGPHGVSLFVDGTALTRISFDCQPGQCTKPLLTDAADPIQVGFNLSHIERMRGTVDEVAIYKRVLTAEEIAAHYVAGR